MELTKIQKLVQFGKECRRVLRVTRKPTMEEFKTVSKVSAIGLSIIGLLGFAISLINRILF